MEQTPEETCHALESATRLLQARERSLRYLAQSSRCTNRTGAELELNNVRTELAATFVKLRNARPGNPAGSSPK